MLERRESTSTQNIPGPASAATPKASSVKAGLRGKSFADQEASLSFTGRGPVQAQSKEGGAPASPVAAPAEAKEPGEAPLKWFEAGKTYEYNKPPAPSNGGDAAKPGWTSKKPDAKKTKKDEPKLDLTPDCVRGLNADWKKQGDALATSVKSSLKGYLGDFTPNDIGFGLALKIDAGEGSMPLTAAEQAKKDKGEVVTPTSAPKIAATLLGTAKIKYTYLKEWPLSAKTSVLGQSLTASLAPNFSIDAGLEASAVVSVSGASEALAVADKVLGKLKVFGTTASEQAAESKKNASGSVDTSGMVPKVKDAGVKETKGKALAAGAGLDAFGGIKAGMGLKAGLKWQKKSAADYTDAVAAFARSRRFLPASLADFLAFAAKYSTGLTELIMGKAGLVDLALFDGKVSGGLGAGLSGKLNVGWSSSKGFVFDATGSAYWGVGGSLSTAVTVDPVEIIRCGIAGLGAGTEIFDQLGGRGVTMVTDLITSVGSLYTGLVDWYYSDSVAIEGVAGGVHRLVPATERKAMVLAICDSVVGNASEQAILEILEFSAKKGDLAEVLSYIPDHKLQNAIDGEEDSLLGGFLAERGKTGKAGAHSQSPDIILELGMTTTLTGARIEDFAGIGRSVEARILKQSGFDAYNSQGLKASQAGVANEWMKGDYWTPILTPTKATRLGPTDTSRGSIKLVYASIADAKADRAKFRGTGALSSQAAKSSAKAG